MDIENIKEKIRQGKYQLSMHAEIESFKDRIEDEGIESAILTGEILEEYPSYPRGHSCLILGRTLEEKYLHVICGNLDKEKILIITVYYPTLPKWINERTRRKG